MINLRQSAKPKENPYDRKVSKKFNPNYTALDAIETVIYELKPIIYFFFSVAVLRLSDSLELWIKFSAVGILVFSLYIIYCRMVYRGLFS